MRATTSTRRCSASIVRRSTVCCFDVRDTERLQISLTDASFFDTGIEADPATVSVVIRKVPQVMIFLLDTTVPFARPFQTDPATFRARVASSRPNAS